MLSPLLSIRVVVDQNDEEVWSISNSYPQTLIEQSHYRNHGPAIGFEGYALTKDSRNKRKIDNISAASTSSNEPHPSSLDSMSGSADDSLEGGDEMLDSVWSVLRPYKYAAIRRDRRSQLRILKVPKNDLRREYLSMFCSAVNAHDPVLLRSFFRQYCDAAVSFHRVCLDGTCLVRRGASAVIKYEGISEANADCQVRRYGQPDAFALWAVKFDVNPDHCCAARDVKVITTRMSNAVRLEADFVIRRTEIYDVSAEKLQYLWQQKVLSSFYAGEACDENIATLRSTQPPDDLFIEHHGLYPLPLAAEPRLFTVTGRFVVNINADRRIESMLLHPTLIECDPVTV